MKMSKKKITTTLITIVIVAMIAVGGYLFSSSMYGKKIINNITSNTTGIKGSVEVYAYDGTLLKSYDGNIKVDDGKGGTISIIVGNDKHTFANATVVITEK